MPVPTRLAGALATAALLLPVTAALGPSPAHAADGQVCTTGPAPTAATRPWFDFAHSENPAWASRTAFGALTATIATAVQPLGAASTEDQVDEVVGNIQTQLEIWAYTATDPVEMGVQLDLYGLYAALRLIDPAAADAAADEMSTASQAAVGPALDGLFADGSGLSTWADQLMDNLSYPLAGPVVLPSAAGATGQLTALAQAIDQWHDLGNAKVSYASATTCISTATLTVPATTTTFGKPATVAISAVKDGLASRGDLVVLLDGEQIGSATQQSSYVAAIPGTLAAGPHVLTVAFAPVDGSPIATRSSTVTVAKAGTATKLAVKKGKAAITVTAPGVAAPVDGTATIKVGKQKLTTKIKNGRGTVKLGRLDPGSYKLKAVYAGSDTFAASTSKAVKVKVAK